MFQNGGSARTGGPLTRGEFIRAALVGGGALLAACTPEGQALMSTLTPTEQPEDPTGTATIAATATGTDIPASATIGPDTATPRPRFELPADNEGSFDFTDFDRYPMLKNLGTDLRDFIALSTGFARDYSQAEEGRDVTNLPLKHLDNRKHPNNARGIVIAYELTREPMRNGTQPFYGVSAAKFNMNFQNENGDWLQENTFVILQQHFIPEAIGRSEIAVGMCPDYTENREKIAQIKGGAWYGALIADFIPQVLEGSLPWRGNFEPAAALYQNRIALSGDDILLDMVPGQKMPPGINGKMFIYDPIYVPLK
jgi:hypothetical protein